MTCGAPLTVKVDSDLSLNSHIKAVTRPAFLSSYKYSQTQGLNVKSQPGKTHSRFYLQ